MAPHFHRQTGSRTMEPMSAGNRVKRFKRFIYVICSNRVVAAFLGNRAVVRGSFSAARLLSLVLFGVTSFLWMVGPQPGSTTGYGLVVKVSFPTVTSLPTTV